jgi:hypothetical protein
MKSAPQVQQKSCFNDAYVSSRAGGLTIFDNSGLVVPELDADGLPPPGTRLRKGMALYVKPIQLFDFLTLRADTGRSILCLGWLVLRRSSMRRRRQ